MYCKTFIILFAIEAFFEGFGYQVVGKWIYGQIWSSDLKYEGIIHLTWMLLINTPVLYWWIMRQLIKQKRLTETIKDKDKEFYSLFMHNSDAIVTFDLNERVTNINPAFERMVGYSLCELKKKDKHNLIEMFGMDRSNRFEQKNNETYVAEFENSIVKKDGRLLIVEEKVVPIYQGDNLNGFYMMMRDVTEQREQQQNIWRLAHYDYLTGLPNRRLFSDRLEKALMHVKTQKSKLAVLFIDLDRFKYINDALGHDVGDEVLRIVSNRMLGCMREGDILARFGGDEFAVLMPHVHFNEEAVELAKRILVLLQDQISFNGYEFHLTSSIGIAMYPTSGESSTWLLRNADAAMYEAKQAGKNRYQVHMPTLQEHAYARLRLERDLRQALKSDKELYLEYQPQVDVENGNVVSAEALVRWRHPVVGVIPPSEFIPLAEEVGLIIDLGQYVLKEVCGQLKKWKSNGLLPIRINVNVSALELEQTDFVRKFHHILVESEISPSLIGIEITETILMKDEKNTRMKLTTLQQMGFKISVDDFGKGYSSLGFLKQFPIDVLKIDQIFVRDVDKNSAEASIVSALITLAHSRELGVIAEGVEREGQLAVLRDHKCDEYQGYFFSHPRSAESFAESYL